jgi:D-alanyl-D-alanine carboxypeptidase
MAIGKRFALVIALAVLLTGRAYADTDEKGRTPMDEALQSALDEGLRAGGGVGASAAVIFPTGAVWLGASGVSERDPDRSVHPRMVFQMASVKKNFVAALIVKLAEEGRLSLDDPVGTWFSSYEHVSPDITVRQLLNHTSGIYDYAEHPGSLSQSPLASADLSKHWTPEEIITTLVGEPYFAPGTGWHYSSTNYLLLQMIAERVTQSDVHAELRTRFFEPLGLSSIFASPGESLPAGYDIAHNWYDAGGDGAPKDLTAMPSTAVCSWAGGELYCTAEDLAKWMVHLADGDIVSQDSLQQMLSFHSPTPGEDWMNGYGLGIARNVIQDIEWWGHAGWIFGYKSGVIYLPRFKLCVAVMTNDNSMAAELIAQNLTQAALSTMAQGGQQ